MISNLLTRDFFEAGVNWPASRSPEIHSETGFRASGMLLFGDEISLERGMEWSTWMDAYQGLRIDWQTLYKGVYGENATRFRLFDFGNFWCINLISSLIYFIYHSGIGW